MIFNIIELRHLSVLVNRGEISDERLIPWANRIREEYWILQARKKIPENPVFWNIVLDLFQNVLDRIPSSEVSE